MSANRIILKNGADFYIPHNGIHAFIKQQMKQNQKTVYSITK